MIADSRSRLMISWIHSHNRSAGLAEAIGARNETMPWARPNGFGPRTAIGWFRSALRTWRLVRALPPGSGVVAMVPPVFAVSVVLLAARPGTRVVVDLHSGAFNDPRWAWSRNWMARLLRSCDAVVVTNLEIVAGIDLGTTPVVVLIDPIPLSVTVAAPGSRAPAGSTIGDGPAIALFPASGARDEPLAELERAALRLRGKVRVVATGNLAQAPSGGLVERVGYLPGDGYWDLFHRSAVVLALTTREATSQQSATEAVAAAKPLVCSNTAMLRNAFGPAAVFCENTGESIADAVSLALTDSARLSSGARRVAAEMAEQRSRSLARLDQLLG